MRVKKLRSRSLRLLRVLAGIFLFREQLSSTKVVIFSDSEAVRGSFLKRWSENDNRILLLRSVFRLEEE